MIPMITVHSQKAESVPIMIACSVIVAMMPDRSGGYEVGTHMLLTDGSSFHVTEKMSEIAAMLESF